MLRLVQVVPRNIFSFVRGCYFKVSEYITVTMRSKFLLSVLSVVALSAFAPLREVYVQLTAKQENGKMVITWTVQDETGVVGYEVLRQSAHMVNASKIPECTVRANQVGKGEYTCVDNLLYKSPADMANYYINVLMADGSTDMKQFSVNYTSTAVRRTWGSIKAMFQ